MNEFEKKKHLKNLIKMAREYDNKQLKKIIINDKKSAFEKKKIKGLEWMEDLK